jgi:hypothetical protein
MSLQRPFSCYLALLLVLAFSLSTPTRPAQAQPIAEIEPNNVSTQAQQLDSIGRANPVQAAINVASDTDWFAFNAVGGQTYVIELFDVAATLGALGVSCAGDGMTQGNGLGVLVLDSAATLRAGGCDAASFTQTAGNVHHFVEFTAPASGRYFVLVIPNSGTVTGNYGLRILPRYDQSGASWDAASFEPNNARANSYALGIGSSAALNSQIEARDPDFSSFQPDKDWYRFTAVAGRSYTVELFSVAAGLAGNGSSCQDEVSGTGVGLNIFGLSGTLIIGDCNAEGTTANGELHHQVQFSAPESGEIYLQVAPNAPQASGGYSLRVCQPTCAPTWLGLLYLAGDDQVARDGVSGLSEPMRDLLARLNRMPDNPALRLIVLFDGDQDGDSKLYEHRGGRLVDVTEQAAASPLWLGGMPGSVGQRELNTGNNATLQNFLSWARATYSGTRYTFLSIVDHGGGWAPDLDSFAQPRGRGVWQAGGWRGMSIDLSSDGLSFSTRDTGTALAGDAPIDVLFFDACLMGMLESAYEVRDRADYLIAGENLLFADLPYDDYFAPARLTATTQPAELARIIVERYNQRTTPLENPFTIAAIDLRHLRNTQSDNLADRVNTLAERLLVALPDPVEADDPLVLALTAAYSQSQKFDYDTSLTLDAREGYVDLLDFAQRLATTSDAAVPADVREAATAVVSATRAAVLARQTVSGVYRGSSWDLSRANGIAIFLPLGERDYRPTYVDSNLPQQAAWGERQLSYYSDPAQLAFSRDMPRWAELLLRLEDSVPLIRTGSSGLPPTTLAAEVPVIKQDFFAPSQLVPSLPIFLPLLRR